MKCSAINADLNMFLFILPFISHSSQTNVVICHLTLSLCHSFLMHTGLQSTVLLYSACMCKYFTLCFNYITGVMAVTLPYSAAVNYALSDPWFCQGPLSRIFSCKESWTSKQREPVFSSNHSGTINKSAQPSVGQNINQRT